MMQFGAKNPICPAQPSYPYFRLTHLNSPWAHRRQGSRNYQKQRITNPLVGIRLGHLKFSK